MLFSYHGVIKFAFVQGVQISHQTDSGGKCQFIGVTCHGIVVWGKWLTVNGCKMQMKTTYLLLSIYHEDPAPR